MLLIPEPLIKLDEMQVSGFQCSGQTKGNRKTVTMKKYLEVEELEVYKKLCQLHIEVCKLTHEWPL